MEQHAAPLKSFRRGEQKYEGRIPATLHEKLLKCKDGKAYGEIVNMIFSLFRYQPLAVAQWAVIDKQRRDGVESERFQGVYEGRLADVIYANCRYLTIGGSVYQSAVKPVLPQDTPENR